MKGYHNLLSRSTTSSTSSPSTLTTFASSSLSLTGSSGSGSSASSASSSSLPLLLSSLQLTLPKCIHTFQVFHTSTTSSVQALLSLFSQLSPLLQRLDEYRDHLPLNRVQRIVRLVSSLHALVTHVRGLALRFLGDCGNTTFLELLRQGEQVVHLNDALETEFADVLQALEQRLRDLTRAMQDGAFLSLLDRPKRPADVCRHPTAKVFWARHFGTARRVKWNAFVAAYLHEFGRLTLARQGLLRKAMGIGSGWEIDVQHLADFTDQLGIPESFNALVHLAESLVDHVALQWPDNMPLRTVLEHIAAKLEIDANHRGNLPARVSETVTMFERNFFFTAGDLRREQDTVWESLLAMDVPFRLASRLRHEIFNVNVSDVYIVNASVALTMLNIKSHAQADFSTGVPLGLIADLDRIASLSVHPDHHSKYRTFLTAYKVLPAVLLILEKLRALSRIRDFDDESEQCASAVVRALVNLTEFGLLNSPHVRMELGNSVRHVPPAQRLAAAIIPSCVATFLGFNNTPRLRKVLQEAISVMLDNPLLSSSEAALLFDALCCETVDELRSSGISSRPLSRLQQTIAMSPPRISRSDTFAGMLRPPNPDDPSLSPALGGLTVTVEEAALSELLVAVDQAAEHTSLSNGFAADRFGLRDGYGTPRHSRQSSGNSSEGGDEDSNSGSGSADSNTLSPRVSHRKQAPSFGDIKLVAASSRSLLLAEVEHEVDEHVAFDAMSDSFMLTVCARVLEEHHNRVAALDRHVGSTVLAASAYMARPWRRMVGELSRSSKLGAHSRHSSREDISERTLLSHSDSTFKPGSFSFSQYSLLPNGDWFYPEDESRGIVLAFHRGNIYGRAVASLASSSSCDCDVIVLRGVYSKEPDEWRWRFNLQYCEVRVERTGHVATNEPRLHTGTITYDKTIERFVLEAKDSAEEFIWYSRVQVPEDKLHTIENKRAQVEKTRLEQLLANPQRSRLGRIGKTPRRSRSQTGMSHVSMSDDSINTLQLAAAGRPRSKSRGGYSSPDRSSGSGSGLSGSASPQLPRRSITAGKTTKMPSFDLSGTTALTSAVSMVVGGKLTRWGRRAVEQLFTFFDGDGDGRLNPSELVVMSLACGTASVDRSALVDADLPDLYAFYEFHGERRLLEDMLTSRAAFALFDSHTGKISKLGLALSGYLHDVVQFFYARSRGSRYLFARKWMAAYRDSPIDDIGEYVEHRGEVILQHELHLIGALPLVDLEAEAHMAQGTCTSVQQQQSAASPTARDSSSNSGSEASPRPRRRPSGVRAAPFLAQVPSASDFLRPLHKYHFVGYSCVTCSTPKSHLICRACARCCHVDHALKGPYFVGSVRDASSLLRCRCDNRKQAAMRTSLQVDLDAREDELVKHETGAHTDLTMFPLLDGSGLAAQASRGAAKEPAVESFWHRAPCQLPAGRFRMSRRNSVDEQVPYDHPFFTSSSTDGLFELAQRHCDYIKTARRAYLRKKRNRAIGDGGSPSLSLHDAHSSADNVVVCVSVKWDVDLQRATRDGLEVSLVVVAPNNIVVDYTHPSERDKLAGVKVLTHWSERGNMRMVGFNPSVADGTYTICVVARPSRANPQPNDPDRLTSFHSIRHDSGMRAIVAQRDRAPLARVAWLSNAAAQGHPLDQRVWYVGAIVMKDGEVRSARLFEQLVPRLMFNHAFDSEVWRPMFYNDQKMHSPLRDEDLKMKAYQNMALNALKPASLRKHLRVSPDLYLTTAVSALRLLRSCHPISMAHLHKIITFLSIDIFSPFIREKKKKAAHTTQKPRRNGGSGKPEAGRFVGGSARPKQDDSTTRPGYIPVSDLVLPPALASEFVRYLDCCLSTACRKPSHAEYFQYVAHLCSLGGRFGPRMLLAFLKFKVMPAMVDSAPLIKWVCYLCKRFMSECGWRGRLLVAEIFDSDDVVSSPSPRVPVPEDSTAAARLGSGKVWDRMSFGNLSTSLWSFKQALQHAAHLEDTALVVDLLNLLLALVEMHLPADPLARKLLLRSLSSTAERNRVHTHAGLATPPFSPNATPRTPEDDDDSSDSDSGRMPLSTVRRFVSNEIEENSDDEGEPVGTIERIIDAGIPFDLVELVFPLRHPLVHSLLFRVLRRLLQYDRGLDADARHGLALLITQQTSFMAYASLGIEEVEENAKHVPADQTDRCLFLAYLFSVTGQQGLHFLNALPEHVAVRLRRKLSCVTDVASPVENGTRMSRSETMSGVDTLYSQNWEEAQRQVFERYDGLVNSLAARKWSSRRVEELLAGKAPSPRPVHQPTRFGSQGRVHGRPGTVSEAGRDDALGDDLVIQDEVVLRQGPVKTQTGFFFKTWSTRWLILTPVALFAARDKDWNGKRLLARLNEFSSVRVPRQHDDLGFDLRYANGDDPLRLQALSPGLRDEWVTQITAALTGDEG